MSKTIMEKIKVGAVFNNSRIIPKWFVWGNRRIDITEINYTWQTKNGRSRIHHFAVFDGVNTYELSYNIEESGWRLAAVETYRKER